MQTRPRRRRLELVGRTLKQGMSEDVGLLGVHRGSLVHCMPRAHATGAINRNELRYRFVYTGPWPPSGTTQLMIW